MNDATPSVSFVVALVTLISFPLTFKINFVLVLAYDPYTHLYISHNFCIVTPLCPLVEWNFFRCSVFTLKSSVICCIELVVI